MAGAGGGCPAGTGECDGDPSTVCEADLTLVTSCGSCTNSCNGANGTVECLSGTCTITACSAGFDDCDADPSNGCEASIVSNDVHCGQCGRNCAAAGTTCSVDQCDAITLHTELPIGSDNSNGLTWTVGDGAIFNNGYGSYTVRRIPMDGAGVTTVWDSSAAGGRRSLVTNRTHVIWVERGTPSVVLSKPFGAAPADLPAVVFTPEYQPYFLQVRGGAYYWFSGDYQSGDPAGYIYTRSTTAAASDPGTRIVDVDQGNHGAVTWFTTSTDALYWFTTDGEEVRTTPLSGGTPTVVPIGAIAGGLQNSRVKMRTAGTTLYYNVDTGTSFANGIYRWEPGESAGTQLVVQEGVVDFVVDDEAIYFVSSGTNGVRKAPITGGASVEITNTGANLIIHQDADSLYVANLKASKSAIYRVLK